MNTRWTKLVASMLIAMPSLCAQDSEGDTGAIPVVESSTSVASGVVQSAAPLELVFPEERMEREAAALRAEVSPIQLTNLLQPTPFAVPRTASPAAVPTPQSTNSLSSRLLSSGQTNRSVLRSARLQVNSLNVDYVRGSEGLSKVTTDVGNLLRKSPAALGVSVQRRTPVMNDPRIRSSRVGALAASGSHWVPARIDLDTALSKVDSRLVEDVLIVPGPYSSLYGPAYNVVDFQLLRSPRFEAGRQTQGRTTVDFQHNGAQWFGQQQISIAESDWGVRLNYGHRTGEDYRTGDGDRIASSYNSRQWQLALGKDLGDERSLEFTLLRLDQTDVEFPGYVFDIDFLVTDGYELAYIDSGCSYCDRFETELWYNRTRFAGNAQNPAKRDQFPLLDRVAYVGFTDVDSMSTGYRQGWTWETESYAFTAGHDLRFIKQELNEISSGTQLGLPIPFVDRNSPIPDSFSANPGLFVEYREQFLDRWDFKTGARFDYAGTDITADAADLAEVGLDLFPASYAEIVGTDQYQRDLFMWSLYGTLSRQHSETCSGSISLGYAERPPNLTELYAAEPFMLLLQNGLNNVTGDPLLATEKMLQCDVNFEYDHERFRAGVRGFHGWGFDYITFENTGVQTGPPGGQVQQIDLRYVNTDLATFTGLEAFAELRPDAKLTPFVNLKYVDARDRTRNGDFATRPGAQGLPSQKIDGLSRGFFSGVAGADAEPLPGISPLDVRLGIRLSNTVLDPRWNLELESRLVAQQDRVATSLLETPTEGFAIFNLRGVYRPECHSGMTLVCGLENFTDRQYREHIDFRSLTGISVFQPGINAYFGADLQY